MSDLISRDALRKAIEPLIEDGRIYDILSYIDNAPSVDTSDTKYLEERDADAYESGYLQGHIEGYQKAEKDYARPQGEWIEISIQMEDKTTFRKAFRCNKCRYVESYTANFCSNCGAAMRKGGDRYLINEKTYGYNKE